MNSRQNNFEAIEVNKVEIDKKLEDIIEKIFFKCISDKENKLALGIAIDSRRIDKVNILYQYIKHNIRLMKSYILLTTCQKI